MSQPEYTEGLVCDFLTQNLTELYFMITVKEFDFTLQVLTILLQCIMARYNFNNLTKPYIYIPISILFCLAQVLIPCKPYYTFKCDHFIYMYDC